MSKNESDLSARAREDTPDDDDEDSAINDRALIFLSGDIDRNHLQVCGELLNYHFMEDFDEPIQLIINSDGGDCSVGWSIIDVMNYIRLPVHTVALGVVASMAADIFVNGDQRTIGQHSMLMIHPHSAMRYGTHSQLLAHSKADSIEHGRRLAHYANNSKYQTVKAVEEKLFTTIGDDLWLTPEEVLTHGLCDQVARTDKAKRRKAFGYSPANDGKITKRVQRRKPRTKRASKK